uniref:proline--tRNA ligase n=1 Tax=Spongospora subterranea TaxID=70186 RepID=A0A0H5R734_9EUKA|eukprot:CRZ09562.1 hypothetical protein [Spongospora subterranea]
MAAVSDQIDRLSQVLKNFGLAAFQSIQVHEKVMTSEDQVKALGILPLSTVLVKNLVLKDKKKQVFLVSFEHDRALDLKALVKQIPGASSSFRFVSDDEVAHLLSVEKGSVTPFAAMNDVANAVTVVLSKQLVESPSVLLHPLTNEATVRMAGHDLTAFLQSVNHSPLIIDFDAPFAVQEHPQQSKPATAVVKEPQLVSLGIDVPKTARTFGPWYSQVVLRSELIDYYDISGCYILRPWSYFIWEEIQGYVNSHIKKMGVKNSYFPLFVSESALCKEKEHVEGFSAEVAWVTKAGTKELDQQIAIRPTSETVMYPLMAKWIRSHRDLPLKLNQWNNVVRWEFKHPTPFIRSREFLWQEGHTAHATKQGAEIEVREILDLYAMVYEELLACPIIKGRKTEREKFAGALYTTTAEAFVPTNGRGVQGATSHCLGQNFAKMFKIEFESGSNQEKQLVWQNSWGLTTRSIGVMVMVHGDDKGLVLPPRIAPIQCIIVPIYYAREEDNAAMDEQVSSCVKSLVEIDIRCEADCRTIYTPGWKYNHWELKGVPLRIEIGPRDLKNNQVVAVRRDTGSKTAIPVDQLLTAIPALLQTMHYEMLEKARAESDALVKKCNTWKEFMVYLNQGNRVLLPFCESESCEDNVKEKSKIESDMVEEEDQSAAAIADGSGAEKLTGSAKSLCIPFDQPDLPSGTKCFCCGVVAKSWTLFGRSY